MNIQPPAQSVDPFAALLPNGSGNPLAPVRVPANNMDPKTDSPDCGWLWQIRPDTIKIRVYGAPAHADLRSDALERIVAARGAAEAERTAKRMHSTRSDDELTALLAAVRSDDGGDLLAALTVDPAEDDVVTLGGVALAVKPHGSASHRLLLTNEHAGVQLHIGPKMDNLGVITGRFGARWCIERGYSAACEWLALVADELSVNVTDASLSELHLACDMDEPFTESMCRRLRGHGSRSISHFRVQGQYSGFSTAGTGRRSPCDVVGYNKKLAESSDPYWHALYRREGLTDTPLWRLECRFSRELLVRAGIESPADLDPDRVASLWAYATGFYLYMATARTEDQTRRDRIDIAPLWQQIQAVSSAVCHDVQPRETEPSLEYDRLFRQGIGCIRSALVRSGVLSCEEALTALFLDQMRHADSVVVGSAHIAADALRGLADRMDSSPDVFAASGTHPVGLIDRYRESCLEIYDSNRMAVEHSYIPAHVAAA